MLRSLLVRARRRAAQRRRKKQVLFRSPPNFGAPFRANARSARCRSGTDGKLSVPARERAGRDRAAPAAPPRGTPPQRGIHRGAPGNGGPRVSLGSVLLPGGAISVPDVVWVPLHLITSAKITVCMYTFIYTKYGCIYVIRCHISAENRLPVVVSEAIPKPKVDRARWVARGEPPGARRIARSQMYSGLTLR